MKRINYLPVIFVLTVISIINIAAPAQKRTTAKRINSKQSSIKQLTDEDFLIAVSNSNWILVKQMILRGANVNAVSDSNSWTALHQAAYYQRLDVVNLLLQKGADVTLIEDDGNTVLHNAVSGCKCENALQKTQLVNLIKVLAKSGANPNLVNNDGYTPLMTAFKYKDSDIGLPVIKSLLANGSDVNFTNRFGENAAFLIKTTEKKDESAQFILSQSSPSSGIISGKISDEEFIKTANSSNWNRLRRMITAGANVNASEKNGAETALYYAAADNDFESVKLLLEKGAKVNVASEFGMTALHRAMNPLTEPLDIELIKLLLDKGADVNAQTKDGWRPLSQAIERKGDNIAVIKLLLSKGANPNLTDNENRNALEQAIYQEETDIVELLKPLVADTTAERRRKLPGKFVKTADNIEIYYEIYGAEKKGAPLVVLHGGPGFDHQYFLASAVFSELAKNRSVIFYDQRGTGFSSKLTVSQMSEVKDQITDLISLVNQLGYKKFDLMGHSWGGFLAMLFAETFPDKLNHLIICDTMAPDYGNFNKYSRFESEYPEEFEEMKQKRIEGVMNHNPQAMRESLSAYMKMLFHSAQKRDSFLSSSGNFTYNADINSRLNSDAEDMDLTGALRGITVPTLIVHGKYDFNIISDVAKNIQGKIPQSQLIIFSESGHLPFYEEPEKFIRVVENFLDGKTISEK